MNRCDPDRNQEFVLDLLAGEKRVAHERHLSGCPACAEDVARYRALFEELRDLPMPPVPAGIPEAVLSMLAPESRRDPIRRLLEPLLDRPIAAALAGGVSGLGIALLYRPAQMLAGRAAGEILADATRWLVKGLDGVVQQVLGWTVVVEIAAGWAQKLAPAFRLVGESATVLVEPSSYFTLGISLATVVVLRLVFGQTQREEFGHVRKR